MASFHMTAGDLDIVITGDANQPHGQDLITMAIVALISEADTSGWEKAQYEKYGESQAQNQFYAAVLSAIARHYAMDWLQEERSTANVLEELIRGLREDGRLQQMIRP